MSSTLITTKSIPTLLLCNQGRVIATKMGAVPLSHLRDFLDALLSKAAA